MSIHPPTAIDVKVGARIKRLRQEQGVSQQELAEALSVSYQQLQKYEAGTNRISAGKLHVAAQVLKKPVCWLFGCPCL